MAHRFWAAADSLADDYEEAESQKPEIPDWNELERLEETIRLLAPIQVSEAVHDNYSKVLEAIEIAQNMYKDKSSKSKAKAANAALEAWWVMNRAMRADLHGPPGQATVSS